MDFKGVVFNTLITSSPKTLDMSVSMFSKSRLSTIQEAIFLIFLSLSTDTTSCRPPLP